MMVARVTIELLRPIPLQPLRLTTSVTRSGKKVQLVSAMLTHEDTEIARATGLRIRVADLGLSFPQPATAIPSPSDGHPANFFANPGAFATDAMEIRMVSGDFNEAGPGQAWLRLTVPLVHDEETTTVERVAVAADFGNGVSNLAGAIRDWVFINPDLEIRMHRRPEGEWVYLDSQTHINQMGTGMATSSLGDEEGWLGVAAQSLFVDPIREI